MPCFKSEIKIGTPGVNNCTPFNLLFMNIGVPRCAQTQGTESETSRDPLGKCNAGGAFERHRVERFLEQFFSPQRAPRSLHLHVSIKNFSKMLSQLVCSRRF